MDISNYYILYFPLFLPCDTEHLWDSLRYLSLQKSGSEQQKKKKKMVFGGCMDSLHVHTRIYLHPTYRNTYTQICMSSEHNNKFTYQHNPLKFNEWPKKKIEYWVLWYTLISGRGTQLSEKSFACSGEWVPSVDDPQC